MANPFEIKEPTCISFSGGRTSAYMLWRVLEAHGGKLPQEAVVCFANTGKEDEATLQFVQDCSTHWNVEIHWIEYRYDDIGFPRLTLKPPLEMANLLRNLYARCNSCQTQL